MFDEVARLAPTEGDAARLVVVDQEILDEVGLEVHAFAGTVVTEYPDELLACGLSHQTLYWMRRRNASSTSSSGRMLVANTTSTMNGNSNFCPVEA